MRKLSDSIILLALAVTALPVSATNFEVEGVRIEQIYTYTEYAVVRYPETENPLSCTANSSDNQAVIDWTLDPSARFMFGVALTAYSAGIPVDILIRDTPDCHRYHQSSPRVYGIKTADDATGQP